MEHARDAAVLFNIRPRCRILWEMMATMLINVSAAKALSGFTAKLPGDIGGVGDGSTE